MLRPKIFTSFLLFVSGYSPLFAMLVIKDFDFSNCVLKNPNISMPAIVLVVLSNIMLFISLKVSREAETEVKVISSEPKSNEFISYTVPYLLAFYGADWSSINNLLSLLLFLAVLFLLSLRSGTIFINPLLSVIGYSLYQIKYEYIEKESTALFLSQEEPQVSDLIDVISLSNSLFIVTKLNKEEE